MQNAADAASQQVPPILPLRPLLLPFMLEAAVYGDSSPMAAVLTFMEAAGGQAQQVARRGSSTIDRGSVLD
eukprot:628432-Rhodomonas_salina.1